MNEILFYSERLLFSTKKGFGALKLKTNAFKDLSVHHQYIDKPFYTWHLGARLIPIFNDILNYHDDNEIKTDKHDELDWDFLSGTLKENPA